MILSPVTSVDCILSRRGILTHELVRLCCLTRLMCVMTCKACWSRNLLLVLLLLVLLLVLLLLLLPRGLSQIALHSFAR
jgi:hypothetical protein